MAIFSDKIFSTKFIDPPNNMIIEVLYQEGDKVIPYILEVDFTSNDFNDLLKEVTLEEIEKNTRVEVNLAAKVFNDAVITKVNELWELEAEKIKRAYEEVDNYQSTMKSDLVSQYQKDFLNNRKTGIENLSSQDIFNHLVQKNEDNDFVFNLKIGILEDAHISKSKDKALKLSIRKAKTVFELFKLYEEAKGAS